MSAAASAIPRMPARKVPYEPHEIEWQQVRQEEGYVRLPLSYGKVLRATSPLQQAILWHIIENTIGQRTAGVQRAAVELSEAKLAKLTDTTRQGVSKALAGLEELKVIRRAGSGRKFQYGLDMEKWRHVQPPPPRKLTRTDEADEDESSDDEQKPLVMKTSEPLVILPGSNSRPRPLSEVCHNTECEVLRSSAKGEPKANEIANKAVNPSECKLQLPSPEAQTSHERFISKLKPRTAEAFRVVTRAVSLVDGVLTLAVRDGQMVEEYERGYSEAAVRAAGLKRVAFIAQPDLFLPPTPENPTAAKSEREVTREWLLTLDVQKPLEDEDIDAALALRVIPIAALQKTSQRRRSPVGDYSVALDMIQDTRKIELQRQQYRGEPLWKRANKNQKGAH